MCLLVKIIITFFNARASYQLASIMFYDSLPKYNAGWMNHKGHGKVKGQDVLHHHKSLADVTVSKGHKVEHSNSSVGF